MFQELMPLLLQRVLILTLSRVGDEEICVNVIPNQVLAYQALAMLSRQFRYGRLSLRVDSLISARVAPHPFLWSAKGQIIGSKD